MCKGKFDMFMKGAGETVKNIVKVVLPPLILSFFGLSLGSTTK